MDFKCAVIICILLSAILVQGQQRQRGERCSCKKIAKKLDVNKTVKLEIFPPSPKCASEEYIATVKRKGTKKSGSKTETKCVSPTMKQVKAILAGKIKNKIQVIKYPSQEQ
ncbi:C-X-C motif chemokine 10-like isoform X2 [Rana temporaria]|uniref:C-X-C motif chemokine 10-like isoform X2 n=1 Tax=Rana temporaria TaxID=8407 RepID=UPI001AAC7877|nr:C-X-C motif chemokine 10-like isoform X2 [Rana temporaria]